ncbi:MAG: glycosyltransferase family 4 protein [Solirubrobacterales bacterium]
MDLPARIGLNLLYLVPGAVGGTEIYARELIPRLAAARPDIEWIVYAGREAGPTLVAENWPTNVRVKTLPVKCVNKPLRIAFEYTLLPLIAARDGVKLLHSLGQTSPLFSRGARVVTIHDLIYHHYPETFPGPAQKGLELIVPASVKRAHRVSADSQATKDDLTAVYGIDPSHTDVVYLGFGYTAPAEYPDEATLRAQFELGERPVVLCVAAALAHKNVPRLFEAFAAMADDSPALVVVGHAGLEQDNLKALAERLGIGGRVHFTGWIESEELEGLYRMADCFAYPTLIEGFGLPVLEAMQRGTPVVCSNTTSVPELAGDAALLVDPLDVAAIAAAIERALTDKKLVAQLIERGYERVKLFTWEKCADDTLACYAAALQRKT